MKRIKFLSVFVFLIVGSFTVMSFTNQKYRKSTAITECLKYIGPQTLLTGHEFLNVNNWTSVLQHPNYYCFAGFDLCAICYDSFTTTPNEARQILFDFYRSFGYLPSHGSIVFAAGSSIKSIIVYRTEEE